MAKDKSNYKKEELIAKIELLGEKDDKTLRAVGAYLELLQTSNKDFDYLTTVYSVERLINTIKTVDATTKGALSKEAYYENKNLVVSIRNAFKGIVDAIAQSQQVVVITSSSQQIKQMSAFLGNIDNAVEFVNKKIKAALAKGNTELAHLLVDELNELTIEIKTAHQILGKISAKNNSLPPKKQVKESKAEVKEKKTENAQENKELVPEVQVQPASEVAAVEEQTNVIKAKASKTAKIA